MPTALASGAQARGTTQVIDLHDESMQGRFELAFTDNGIRYQSGPIAFNASAQVLRQALLDAVGGGASFASRGGDASVSFIGATGNQQWQVSFGGAALGRHVAIMDGTITQIQRAPQAQLLKLADGATTSAVQRITAPPAGQWFVLSHAGQTTAALPAEATAAQVQSALESLSNIGGGNVRVSALSEGWSASFQGQLAGQAVAGLRYSEVQQLDLRLPACHARSAT